MTPQTIKTRPELLRRIEKVRTTGYAEELEESVEGVLLLAVGLASMGFPGAAISVAVPKQRLGARRRTEIIRLLSQVMPGTTESRHEKSDHEEKVERSITRHW